MSNTDPLISFKLRTERHLRLVLAGYPSSFGCSDFYPTPLATSVEAQDRLKDPRRRIASSEEDKDEDYHSVQQKQRGAGSKTSKSNTKRNTKSNTTTKTTTNSSSGKGSRPSKNTNSTPAVNRKKPGNLTTVTPATQPRSQDSEPVCENTEPVYEEEEEENIDEDSQGELNHNPHQDEESSSDEDSDVEEVNPEEAHDKNKQDLVDQIISKSGKLKVDFQEALKQVQENYNEKLQNMAVTTRNQRSENKESDGEDAKLAAAKAYIAKHDKKSETNKKKKGRKKKEDRSGLAVVKFPKSTKSQAYIDVIAKTVKRWLWRNVKFIFDDDDCIQCTYMVLDEMNIDGYSLKGIDSNHDDWESIVEARRKFVSEYATDVREKINDQRSYAQVSW